MIFIKTPRVWEDLDIRGSPQEGDEELGKKSHGGNQNKGEYLKYK